MAKKKAEPTNEPMIEKIAGKLGHMTGEVIVAKNNLVNMAGGAIDSVKSTIQKITAKKPKAKKAVKKAVKATVKKVEKKVATAKKAAKATVKKVVKKTAPAKKAVKKVVKKVSGKK